MKVILCCISENTPSPRAFSPGAFSLQVHGREGIFCTASLPSLPREIPLSISSYYTVLDKTASLPYNSQLPPVVSSVVGPKCIKCPCTGAEEQGAVSPEAAVMAKTVL